MRKGKQEWVMKEDKKLFSRRKKVPIDRRFGGI